MSVALVLPATSAHAQSAAEEAFKFYADGLRKLGIEVGNDPVQYDSSADTLTVSNFKMKLSGSFELPFPKKSQTTEPGTPADDGNQQLEYALEISSPTMTLTGLSRTDGGGIHADSWLYPDGAGFAGNLKVDGDSLASMNLTMSGLRALNYTAVIPELPAEDSQRPASRWLPVLALIKAGSYDSVEVDKTSGTVSFTTQNADGVAVTADNTITMTGYRVLNYKDGIVGEFSIDGFTQDVEAKAQDQDGLVKQTSSQGRTVYKDINIGNYLALLDPSVPETGEPMPFLGSAHTEDYAARQDLAPGQSVSIKLDSADITGLTVTKRDFDFLGFLDQLITTREASPAQIVPAVFQVYRSFGVSDVRMRGYEISIPIEENPGQPITLSMGEIGMSDLSSDRIGEVVVSDINTSGLPEGAQFSLGKAQLGNLDFAPYGPMTDLISALIEGAGNTPPDAMQIARVFAPRSISYGLENLHVVAPGKGAVTIGRAEQSFSTTLAPIPTDISTKTENASIPVAALNDPKATAFLEAIGLKTLTWSDETRLYWDETTLELTLEKLMIDVQGIGRAEATMKFANVPKALFEDPQNQAQIALVSSAFVGAEISFADAGVTTKAIQKMAQDAGVPEEAFAQALVAQAEAALAPINDPAFTKTVSDAVADFLANPGTFRVVLAPVKPVPVAQIVGSVVTPQVLPGLLNVQVTSSH
ncbi:hypothetical protein [uncultured Roseibium sp.]|uniref:hypothetical protein n=1 Tax=uncultured Roseibium sp. TaxID=1936171 RepID=UPI003216C1BC